MCLFLHVGTLSVCLLLHYLIDVGRIALLELMALRVLALSSPRGVGVSGAHATLRSPLLNTTLRPPLLNTTLRPSLLTTPARGFRHSTNSPCFSNHAFCALAPRQSSTISRRHYQTIVRPDNDQLLSIPGDELEWIIELKDGLDKKECVKIAGFIQDHVNKRKVSNVKVPTPSFTITRLISNVPA